MCYDIGKKTMERKDSMLPQDFLDRMQQQLGQEYPAFLQALARPRTVALRFNPLKGGVRELPFLQGRVPWENMGYYYDITQRPGLHPYHEAGVYYLQEASAMAPARAAEIQLGDKVLDLCAAPGGKSSQVAAAKTGFCFNPAEFARCGEHPFLYSYGVGRFIRSIAQLDLVDALWDGSAKPLAKGNGEVKELMSILRCHNFPGCFGLGCGGIYPGSLAEAVEDFRWLLDNM